jgi:hypothetical protein
MKPFNLEEALAGKPLVTRAGRPMFLVVFDENLRPYSQLIVRDKDGYLRTRFKDGKVAAREVGLGDLFMAPVKKQITVYLFRYKPTGVFMSTIEPVPCMSSASYELLGQHTFEVEE